MTEIDGEHAQQALASRNEDVCSECLERAELVSALSDHIASVARSNRKVSELLALDNEELVAAVEGGDCDYVLGDRKRSESSSLEKGLERQGLFAICLHSNAYPRGLAQLSDMPAALYFRGCRGRLQMLDRLCISIVGARRASPYGLEVARAIGAGLASAGVTVVSGMAFGVDAAAHRGALEAGGSTVAVLAGGVDRPYPRSHLRLYEEICEKGLAVSELAPGTEPRRWSFPARNRIMAAFSAMTVVVEAGKRSGSLITADLATTLGREVGAVPGPVNSHLAQGTNALIADGAKLIRDTEDVLDEFQIERPPPGDPADSEVLDDRQRRILSLIESGSNTLDQLVSDEGEGTAIAAVAELEIKGFIRRGHDGRYIRTGKGLSPQR